MRVGRDIFLQGKWASGVVLFIAFILVLGGSSRPDPVSFIALTLVSIAMLAASLWQFQSAELQATAAFPIIIVLSSLGVMALQLLPLPPAIWHQFPGREFMANQDQWAPLTLAATTTAENCLAILPALATFVAMLTLPQQSWPSLAALISGFAILSTVIAVFQKASGQMPVGLFANRNFLAAQIYCALPFLAALSLKATQNSSKFLALACALMLVAGLGATGSRSGFIFGTITLAAACVIARKHFSSAYLVVIPVLILLFSSVGLVRLVATDPAVEFRNTIFATSWQTMLAYFPSGAGFGSFVPAYQIYENIADLQPALINHAHNDWLELVLEGGLPMALLLIAFIIWFSRTFIAAWTTGDDFSKAAASASALLLVHSVIDYPLRSPALMTCFALSCAMMMPAKIARQLASNSKSKTNFQAHANPFAPQQGLAQ
jgi:O-antigen ligase